MNVKGWIFAILVVFLVFLTSSRTEAVNTRLIDDVLQKSVLDSQDLQIIDNFIDEAVRELIGTRDFSDIAQIRTVILSRQSNQAQYAEQFSESAYKYISQALQKTARLTPEGYRALLTMNLLILIDGLENPRIAELVIENLKDKNTIIRYWAVHCLTNPNVTKKLNAGGTTNLTLARNIVAELNKIVESSSPETLVLIAKFAGDIKTREAEGLLIQLADTRIKKYAIWTVEYELLDCDILKSLSNKMTTTDLNNSSSTTSKSNPVAGRFGQLYSYVIQRYLKGQRILSDTQKNQLASVIVETEDKCISKLMGRIHTTIKRAVEENDMNALFQEHNKLLGEERTAGELPSKFNFDYGGSTAPLALPEPPKNKELK